MKRAILATSIVVLLAGGAASAHIMVSPPEAKVGVNQNYELRVHNEGKLATTAVDLEIPEGITVLSVPVPASGTFKTTKSGDRITGIAWTVDVPPTKYVALKFTAKNPDAAKDVRWNVRQHLADGSVIDWSDKPGAKEKASVTKIGGTKAAGDADHDADHNHADHGDRTDHSVPADHDHPGR